MLQLLILYLQGKAIPWAPLPCPGGESGLKTSYSEAGGKWKGKMGRFISMFLNLTALIFRFRGLTSHWWKQILEFCCCFFVGCIEKWELWAEDRSGQALWALSPISLFIVDPGVNWKRSTNFSEEKIRRLVLWVWFFTEALNFIPSWGRCQTGKRKPWGQSVLG